MACTEYLCFTSISIRIYAHSLSTCRNSWHCSTSETLASHNQRASEGANYCSSFLTALPASFGHPPERVVDVPCSVGLVMQIYENCNEK